MKRNERGFTLLETQLIFAISAVIALGAGITAMQIMKGTGESNSLMTVTNEVNNIDYWVSRDILSAQSVNASDDMATGEIEFVVMRWCDWETGETHDIRYIWLASIDSLYKIKRQNVIFDKNDIVTSNSTILVADNIYSANLTQENDQWKLIVESRSKGKSSSREYFIGQRQECE